MLRPREIKREEDPYQKEVLQHGISDSFWSDVSGKDADDSRKKLIGDE